MKRIAKILLLTASLFLSVLLAACGGKSSGFTGTWKAVSYNVYGTLMSTADMGETTLELQSGGKGTLALMGDSAAGITWKEKDSTLTVTLSDADLKGTMNGNVLVLGDEDMQLYLTKDGAEAKWEATPDAEDLNAAIGDLQSGNQTAAADAAGTIDVNAWYGNYAGTFVIDDVFGETTANYKGEEDPVYGYISQDSTDYLELFLHEDYDSTKDSPFFSMYITVYDSYFEPAGEDNWIGDYDFSAADNAVSASTITSTDPLTVTLYGTYYDPSGTTATSDGFYWSMELIKQGGSAAAASAAPASGSASVSGGNAGLGDFAFSGATKTYTGGGVTMTYPSDRSASTNSVGNAEVQFDNDTWVTAEKTTPALQSYEDMLEYEKGYSGDVGYQLSESTYNGRKCMVMMHDGADNNDYEAEIEIVVYDDDGSSVAIHVSTLNEPLSSILANTDLMATATHVTW
jgi:hypothetical protein